MEGYSRKKRTAKRAGSSALCGSYTVEAAFVIPMVFFVLAALVIASFYVHDRAVLQGMLCEQAAAGSNTITQEERQAVMRKLGGQMKASRLLGSQKLSGSHSSGTRELNTSAEAVYPVPGMVMRYYSGGRLRIRESWNTKLPDPAKTIWTIRGAKEVLEEVTK